jgi:hypothetical protein
MNLTAEQMIDAAREKTGLEHFHSESFREGLEILVPDFRRSPLVTPAGHDKFDALYVSLLANRLRTDDYIRRHPEVLDETIDRPVVVLGMPRTGTTLVTNLLGADPARRSLLKWEIYDSVPPPTTETLRSDPRFLARAKAQAEAAEKYKYHAKAHYEEADSPSEDIFVMAHDMRTIFNESMATMPAYSEWLANVDMTPAYDYWIRALKMLQSNAPGVWNLKMPSHAWYIRNLLKAVPNARIVWTHRDPYKTVGSLCSLISKSHLGYADRPDTAGIAAHYPQQLAAHVEAMMGAVDDGFGDQIYDLHYADVMADPMGEIRKLYSWLGDEMTPEAEAGMDAWLKRNPQGKFGRHEYSLGKFGLTVEGLKPLFAHYESRYTIEPEG